MNIHKNIQYIAPGSDISLEEILCHPFTGSDGASLRLTNHSLVPDLVNRNFRPTQMVGYDTPELLVRELTRPKSGGKSLDTEASKEYLIYVDSGFFDMQDAQSERLGRIVENYARQNNLNLKVVTSTLNAYNEIDQEPGKVRFIIVGDDEFESDKRNQYVKKIVERTANDANPPGIILIHPENPKQIEGVTIYTGPAEYKQIALGLENSLQRRQGNRAKIDEHQRRQLREMLGYNHSKHQKIIAATNERAGSYSQSMLELVQQHLTRYINSRSQIEQIGIDNLNRDDLGNHLQTQRISAQTLKRLQEVVMNGYSIPRA